MNWCHYENQYFHPANMFTASRTGLCDWRHSASPPDSKQILNFRSMPAGCRGTPRSGVTTGAEAGIDQIWVGKEE